jgi:cytochrome c oxidase cbb3-type subunit 2
VVGVPYSDAMVENAKADLEAQANPEGDSTGLAQRYGKAKVADFDGQPARVTEMDALVAYLQMLGTLAELKDYRPEYQRRAAAR